MIPGDRVKGSEAEPVRDLVQEAATLEANEISDPVVLAMRGSNQFSLCMRLLRERSAGQEYRFGLSSRGQIRQALLEILAIVSRIDERLA